MNVGGPAVQISGLMRGLDSRLFDQHLITGYCSNDEADYLETQAPDVAAQRIRGLGRAVNFTDDIRALKELTTTIRQFNPDIVHTHTAKAGLIGRLSAKASLRRIHLVHTFHGHLLHGYFSPRRTRAVIAVEKSLAAATDRLVAVGPEVRDDLLAAGIGTRGKFEVIPPGLQMGVIPSKGQARLELGLADQGPVVLMLGRLTSIKRPDRFVEVVKRVSSQLPGTTFIVAGAGDKQAELADACEAHSLPVKMLGWRSDVERLLAASDLLVLTSDNEGTPLSLIQAALAGVPVVSTDVGSVRHIVQDGETGLLCPPDAKALADAISRLISDPDKRARMGKVAKDQAGARYSVDRLVQDHANLYRKLVER